jgi:uncharacterized protein YjbI with pentapeptide repeats
MKLHGVSHRLEADQARLSGSMFVNSNLSGATFNDVNMSGLTLENVNLSGARVHNANLSGVRIDNANLSGMTITNAALEGMTINGIAVPDLLAAYATHNPLADGKTAASPSSATPVVDPPGQAVTLNTG